jgi:hypothetical protein
METREKVEGHTRPVRPADLPAVGPWHLARRPFRNADRPVDIGQIVSAKEFRDVRVMKEQG